MRIDVDTSCPTCGAEVPDEAAFCRACGFAQPGNATRPAHTDVEPYDPRALPALLPTQPSRAGLFLTVGIVLLVLGTTVPVLVIRSVFFGPDDVVRGYFSALAARDADTAWAALDPEGVDRASNPLLSRLALRGEGYRPPTNFALTAMDVNGADAVATVRYDVAGQTQVEQVSVHRGRATNIFQRWHVRDGVHPLPLAVPFAGQFTVAGATIVVDGRGGTQPLAVFPGAYVLSLADNPLLQANPVTIVPGERAAPVTLTPQLKVSAQNDIARQVREWVDNCAKMTTREPPGCPFSAYSGYAEPVRWQVLGYPTLGFDIGSATEVRVTSTSPGSVRLTGAPSSYSSPSTDSFSVSGVASASNGSVVFTPDR